MVFPWVGLFEQVRLADVFVHYDDVQFPQGRSFVSRVQVKTPEGVRWLTVPVLRSGELIKDMRVDDSQRWRERHMRMLQMYYAHAPFADDMLGLVARVYAQGGNFLCDLNCRAIEEIAAYFGMHRPFLRSSTMRAHGKGTDRLLALVLQLGGDTYITGHGARHYFDHELFESSGVCVEYMNYQCRRYPQQHGDFTPYVSILDLIANSGKAGAQVLVSGTSPWRDFLQSRSAT